jgi:hypothetical protein
MATLGLGDYLALFGVLLNALKSASVKAERAELIQMRAALKSLYFSELTIKRLESMSSIEELDSLAYEAGQASIKQRDTRDAVKSAFKVLEKFLERENLSISGGRAIREIVSSKFEVRHQIEAAYFSIMRNGSAIETADLADKIRKLNSLIEKLDSQLGGLDLVGK